jgi:Fe2+ or Zn2+ uptake regulation protein
MKIENLIKAIEDKKVKPSQLTTHQRRLIVKYYLEEQSHISNRTIANLIGVSDTHISRMKREVLKKSAWEIEEIDVKILAVSLKKKKEEYQRLAREKGDTKLAWDIEMDYIEKMQSLGFIFEMPKKTVHQGDEFHPLRVIVTKDGGPEGADPVGPAK